MKAFLMLVAVFVAWAAAPAVADDGQVPQSTLRALGLGGMQAATDAQGMQVRGRQSAFGSVKGTSLIFGQLLTPDTKNFVVGSSVNEVDGNAETTASPIALSVTKDHGVLLQLDLAVIFPTLPVTSFHGTITGVAGGAGSVAVTGP